MSSTFQVALVVKNQLANAGDAGHRFNPWVWKIPWSKKWHPPPVFLPGKFHGQRSLADYSPWGHRVRRDWARECLRWVRHRAKKSYALYCDYNNTRRKQLLSCSFNRWGKRFRKFSRSQNFSVEDPRFNSCFSVSKQVLSAVMPHLCKVSKQMLL